MYIKAPREDINYLPQDEYVSFILYLVCTRLSSEAVVFLVFHLLVSVTDGLIPVNCDSFVSARYRLGINSYRSDT